MIKTRWEAVKSCYRAYLPLDLPPQACFVYSSSNNMVPTFQGPNLHYVTGFAGKTPSQDVIVVGDENTRKYILAGAVTAKRSLSYFFLHRNGRQEGISVCQPMIAAGEEPEELVVLEGDDWRELLVQYANITAGKMQVKMPDSSRNLSGYCTWYYYYDAVSEQNLLDNLAAIQAADTSRFPVEVVQIDDGYQRHQGDWLDAHENWPGQLAETAAKIIASGRIPGIWLMPFMVSTASRVYAEHPEYLVKDAENKPIIISGWSAPPDHLWACLDGSNPMVQAHLRNVVKSFWAMGFRYFKFDALGYGMPDGVRYDKNCTAVSAFREGLAVIRRAVPEATILGCGAPYMAVLGLVDNCRVSQDTSRYWINPSNCQYPPNCETSSATMGIRGAFHTTCSNWWMFDRWFRADPDVIMARQDNAFYTFGEARISALAGMMTGVVLTSDHLGTIAPERMALLERCAKYRLRDVRPQLCWCDRWPYSYSGTVDGKFAVAVVNDTEEEIEFKFSDLQLPVSCVEVLQNLGKITEKIIVAAHDAALLIAE